MKDLCIFAGIHNSFTTDSLTLSMHQNNYAVLINYSCTSNETYVSVSKSSLTILPEVRVSVNTITVTLDYCRSPKLLQNSVYLL